MRAFPPLKNASFRTALALCITACFCVMLYSIVYAERPISYLCSTEMTTGFRLDESTGKWQVAKFKESKYIISNSDASGWYVEAVEKPLAGLVGKDSREQDARIAMTRGHTRCRASR